MILSSLSVLTLTLSAVAQVDQPAGGSVKSQYQWIGSQRYEELGSSLAALGDVNLDGVPDFLLGAPRHSGAFDETGAVVLISGIDGSTIYDLRGSAANQHFGQIIVPLGGDIDFDGIPDFVIGDDSFPGPEIRAYSGATGIQIRSFPVQGIFRAEDSGSLAGPGDINLDGVPDLLVGESLNNSPGGLQQAGSAYLYSGLDSSRLQEWHGYGAYDLLGRSLAGIGDINLDGYPDILIGAHEASPGGIRFAGSAYAFSGADGSMLFQWDGTTADDYYARFVHGAGDLNADGYPDLLLGSDRTESGVLDAYSGKDGSLLHRWDDRVDSGLPCGDQNEDGYDDIMLVNNGQLFIHSGRDYWPLFKWKSSWTTDKVANFSLAGDLNQDGVPEILGAVPKADIQGIANSGIVEALSFYSMIHSSEVEVSAALGGTISLELRFPERTSGNLYRILLSSTGRGPTRIGVEVPLDDGPLLRASAVGSYPMATTNMHGTLDAQARASASMTFPAGLSSGLVGKTIYAAGVDFLLSGPPRRSSIPVGIAIVP